MYYSSEVVVVEGSVPERLFMLKEGLLVTSILNLKGDEVKIDELIQPGSLNTKKYLWVLLKEAIRQEHS
jgi:hypothetical protein